MSDKFESYVCLLILWFIGCILGYFMVPNMPILGSLVGGNSVIACSTFLEVYGNKQ